MEDMKKILAERVEILEKAKNNKRLQDIEKEMCKRDILYYFRNYVYTDKNSSLYDETYPDVLPFIPYPYQEECIREVWDSIMK